MRQSFNEKSEANLMHHKTIVSVRALCKDFLRPNGTQFTALEGINLDVYDGEFLAIVGLSGSGKTTLLRCLANLIKQDRGQITFAQPIKNKPLVSFVFQNFALFPWLTVGENIEVALSKSGAKEKEQRLEKILSLVGLEGFEDALPKELSGGMRQRVSIARAMVCEPMLMLMDEPFSSLDPLTGESLRSEIGRLWSLPDRGIQSTVMVTHSLQEALQLADRVVILSSNPGSIYKTIDIPLPRPRDSRSAEFLKLETYLERTFGELHLDKLTAAHYDTPLSAQGVQVAVSVAPFAQPGDKNAGNFASKTTLRRVKPLINASLVLVEGLLARLVEETGAMDLYELAEDMGQSVDQMLPAVASAEMLGFINTPGTSLVLTELGRSLAQEQDLQNRKSILREAVKSLPVVSNLYQLIKGHGEEGLEREIAVEQLVLMLPFEDPEVQFEAMLKWCRHVNLFSYDSQSEILLSED
jgi:NitT/TauT family transport system ATP-binding protein